MNPQQYFIDLEKDILSQLPAVDRLDLLLETERHEAERLVLRRVYEHIGVGERFETVRSLRFTLGRLDARLGPSPVPAVPPPRALTTCFPQTPHIEAVARLRRVA